MIAVSASGCDGSRPVNVFTTTNSDSENPPIIDIGSSGNPESSDSPNSSNSSESSSESSEEVSQEESSSGDGSIYDENIYYALYKNEKEFAAKSLFVGDSICKGLMTYSVVDAKNVFATGSVATRNFFEANFFYYGKNRQFLDVLTENKPKFVLFSMGMNDVNMISPQQYCKNYSTIISTVLDNSNAEVIICAITPICSSFTPDGRIDEFNATTKAYIEKNYKERVHFVDFTEPLKNKEGRLKSYFSGGDGVHLAPEAYYAAFHELYSIVSVTDYFNKPDVPDSSQGGDSSKPDSESSGNSGQTSSDSNTESSSESSDITDITENTDSGNNSGNADNFENSGNSDTGDSSSIPENNNEQPPV